MRTFIINYQVYALIGCGVACILFTIFTAFITFQAVNKKQAMLKIETITATLLIADACAYIFRGGSDELAYWMVRISNFLVFLCSSSIVYAFNEYMVALFMEKGKFKKLPVSLLLGFILPSVGVTLLVISQFNGMFYYFDANNCYVRGPFFILSYVFPALTLIIQLVFVIHYRKLISARLVKSLIIATVFPMIAAVLQIFLYGVSIINFCLFLSTIVLIAMALIDLNNVLSKSANTDFFTGLPNTYGFLNMVDRAVHCTDITAYNAYYFDIVNMGQINNRYSKEVGDELIVAYANYVRVHIEKDEILGRLGGNFFVALILKSNTEKFLNMLQDVPAQVKFKNKSVTIHVSAVAGGYEIKNKNIAPGQIMGKISAAVVYAKNVVKRPYIFMDDELEQQILGQKEMSEKLLAAFDDEEFEPFYQPKVDAESGVLCGSEALVRWRHDGEIVPPAKFVPVMEKSEIVCDLDFYMLRHVCADLKNWIAEGINPPTVSVNFSRKNLSNNNMAEDIYDIVKSYEIPVNLIQVEITETIDRYPMSRLREVVDKLRSYGIATAIDDFGTGSSSISLLKEVTFDVLKVDKAFVDYTDDREKKLLSYIIKMADAIGISVLAEGVEDKEQVETLKQMGCRIIQGYYFDKPLVKADYEVRMREGSYTK